MLEHIIPVFRREVDGQQFNAEFIADGLCIRQVGGGGAVFGIIVLFPVLHKQPGHLITLLLQ